MSFAEQRQTRPLPRNLPNESFPVKSPPVTSPILKTSRPASPVRRSSEGTYLFSSSRARRKSNEDAAAALSLLGLSSASSGSAVSANPENHNSGWSDYSQSSATTSSSILYLPWMIMGRRAGLPRRHFSDQSYNAQLLQAFASQRSTLSSPSSEHLEDEPASSAVAALSTAMTVPSATTILGSPGKSDELSSRAMEAVLFNRTHSSSVVETSTSHARGIDSPPQMMLSHPPLHLNDHIPQQTTTESAAVAATTTRSVNRRRSMDAMIFTSHVSQARRKSIDAILSGYHSAGQQQPSTSAFSTPRRSGRRHSIDNAHILTAPAAAAIRARNTAPPTSPLHNHMSTHNSLSNSSPQQLPLHQQQIQMRRGSMDGMWQEQQVYQQHLLYYQHQQLWLSQQMQQPQQHQPLPPSSPTLIPPSPLVQPSADMLHGAQAGNSPGSPASPVGQLPSLAPLPDLLSSSPPQARLYSEYQQQQERERLMLLMMLRRQEQEEQHHQERFPRRQSLDEGHLYRRQQVQERPSVGARRRNSTDSVVRPPNPTGSSFARRLSNMMPMISDDDMAAHDSFHSSSFSQQPCHEAENNVDSTFYNQRLRDYSSPGVLPPAFRGPAAPGVVAVVATNTQPAATNANSTVPLNYEVIVRKKCNETPLLAMMNWDSWKEPRVASQDDVFDDADKKISSGGDHQKTDNRKSGLDATMGRQEGLPPTEITMRYHESEDLEQTTITDVSSDPVPREVTVVSKAAPSPQPLSNYEALLQEQGKGKQNDIVDKAMQVQTCPQTEATPVPDTVVEAAPSEAPSTLTFAPNVARAPESISAPVHASDDQHTIIEPTNLFNTETIDEPLTSADDPGQQRTQPIAEAGEGEGTGPCTTSPSRQTPMPARDRRIAIAHDTERLSPSREGRIPNEVIVAMPLSGNLWERQIIDKPAERASPPIIANANQGASLLQQRTGGTEGYTESNKGIELEKVEGGLASGSNELAAHLLSATDRQPGVSAVDNDLPQMVEVSATMPVDFARTNSTDTMVLSNVSGSKKGGPLPAFVQSPDPRHQGLFRSRLLPPSSNDVFPAEKREFKRGELMQPHASHGDRLDWQTRVFKVTLESLPKRLAKERESEQVKPADASEHTHSTTSESSEIELDGYNDWPERCRLRPAVAFARSPSFISSLSMEDAASQALKAAQKRIDEGKFLFFEKRSANGITPPSFVALVKGKQWVFDVTKEE